MPSRNVCNYSEGLLSAKELKLSYINKLLEINSNEGYIVGEHLIKMQKMKLMFKWINYDKAKEEAYPFLLENIFPDKYPIFFKCTQTSKKQNKRSKVTKRNFY